MKRISSNPTKQPQPHTPAASFMHKPSSTLDRSSNIMPAASFISMAAAKAAASVFQSSHFVVFFSHVIKHKYYSSVFQSPQTNSLHFRQSKLHKNNSQFVVCRSDNNVQQGEVVEITDDTWKEQVIESEIPVIVLFWAPSCGPCKMVAPVIRSLAKEYAGKVACYKINTDECLKIARACGIRSIPTVLLFKNGEQKESITGALSKIAFYDVLGKYL